MKNLRKMPIIGIRLSLLLFACLSLFSASVAWGQRKSLQSNEVTWGRSLISSSNTGSNVFNGTNINAFLGAERFYNSGYTGSTAIVANIEAGHARGTHNTLSHITQTVTGTGATGAVDRHATAVTHAMSGRLSANNYPTNHYGYGIAHGAETWTGAIATVINGDGSFATSSASVASTYSTIMQSGVGGETAHVFNSSWGFSEPTGYNLTTVGVDGLINENRTVGVASAGNSGPGANTVGGIGAGYNSITVAAMGSDTATDPYSTVSSFSSRGPNDFYNPLLDQTFSGVRAAVDIGAPGQNLTLATDTADNTYASNWAGTSFSAPIVAGGAGLVVDVGNQLYGTADAIDGRVVKAVLMNSADKTAGWDNGQFDDSGVIRTTQSLDYAIGAGRMNLDKAFDQYVLTSDGGMAGTADVAGTGTGDLGDVAAVGWDYGQVDATDGSLNSYFIESRLQGGSIFTATLTWFADRLSGSLANFSGANENHLANMDLLVFEFDNLQDRNIIGTVAISDSLYNMAEHLSFLLPNSGFYGISVRYTEAHWDFGTAEVSDQYGLAWSSSVAVPEPAMMIPLFVVVIAVYGWRKKKHSFAAGSPV